MSSSMVFAFLMGLLVVAYFPVNGRRRGPYDPYRRRPAPQPAPQPKPQPGPKPAPFGLDEARRRLNADKNAQNQIAQMKASLPLNAVGPATCDCAQSTCSAQSDIIVTTVVGSDTCFLYDLHANDFGLEQFICSNPSAACDDINQCGCITGSCQDYGFTTTKAIAVCLLPGLGIFITAVDEPIYTGCCCTT